MILTNYAIKFRTAVFVFIAVLIIVGINSYNTLPREGNPDITIPYVFVTAIYEGTSPEDIEKLITIPMEKELNDVSGLKEITSISDDSVAIISMEFEAGSNMDMALQRAKNKIDLARPDLPTDLEEPVVDSINFSSDVPVYTFTISGSDDLQRMNRLAERIQDNLELIHGVKEVIISGSREREIRVELDMARLAAYRIPVTEIMSRIASENATTTAGNLEMNGSKFQVRVPGEFNTAAELRNILIRMINGSPVYLTDIAKINDTWKDLSSIARINAKPCINVGITKRSGANAVKMIELVEAQLYGETKLPPGIEITEVMDQSEYVADMISELENNITTGFILVVITLLLFMGGRNSLFVAMAIPFSMMIAFAAMTFMDTTLNMMVLFSLVLAVGMLVDNAIVIVENIYRHRTQGETRSEAARIGASEVAWPVITSTLTTLAAFSPLLFWPGIMGQFMSYLPRTLIVTLTASLFVAIVINPAICSVFIGGKKTKKSYDTHVPHPFVQRYERILRCALNHRVKILISGLLFLVLSIQVYIWRDLGSELFAETEPRNTVLSIRFPQGTAIEHTDQALANFEQQLTQYPDIDFYASTAGSAGDGVFTGGGSGSHLGSIHIEFTEFEDRSTNSMTLVDTIRNDIGELAGANVKVEPAREGPPLEAPIAIKLYGEAFDVLADTSKAIIHEIATIPGLVDLRSDLEDALPELQFHVDRKRAAMLGLDTRTIGIFLRTALFGIEASKFRAGEEEYDITLRLPLSERNHYNLLEELFIPTPDGRAVPLSSLGTFEYTGGRGAIRRCDQKRVVTITGNNENRGVDVIIKDVQARLDAITLPPGCYVDYAGDTKEMQEAFAFLLKAFVIAVSLILIILVIQFNSVLTPLIILFSVALSLIGVMWGLVLTGTRFGVIMTGLGVISLAGIVVNNAIVLLDCIIQRRAEGHSLTEAIVYAGRTRLRPVLLTAFTTILGLIPMAIGYSLEIHQFPPRFINSAESSAWWAPMAIAVIFGLACATVLTLLLVPVMYSLSDSAARSLRLLFPRHDD